MEILEKYSWKVHYSFNNSKLNTHILELLYLTCDILIKQSVSGLPMKGTEAHCCSLG